MKIKSKSVEASNFPPCAKPSMRGNMDEKNDSVAVLIFSAVMLFFMLFSVLSVINSGSETEDENNNSQIEKIKERIFRILQ
jgi:hypothetical protein